MQLSLAVVAILPYHAILASSGLVTFANGYGSRSLFAASRVKRFTRPNNVHINLQAPPPSVIAGLPRLPASYSKPATNLTTNLTAAEVFDFRVPHSTIELKMATTGAIDGQFLGNELLRMHDWLNAELALHGDATLAERKDDPFNWDPTGDPPLPFRFTAESAPGEHMTYSILLVVVEGLYLCLPAVGRDFGAKFIIWDWQDQAVWGHGELEVL